jgi:chorismate mutase
MKSTVDEAMTAGSTFIEPGAVGSLAVAPVAVEPSVVDPVEALRARIDRVDLSLIQLWLERAELSKQVGEARMAAGGTRLVLAREQAIVDRYREALGADGSRLAMLLLRAGRGPL